MRKSRLLKYSAPTSGFTLLEIMVVIVVISIVAGFAIPNYARSILKQRERDAIIQLSAVHAAAQFYQAQTGDYWANTCLDCKDTISSNLNMKIVSPDLVFDYTSVLGSNTFIATASWIDSVPSKDFTVQIDQNLIDTAIPNPCCVAGTACPSLPDC